jgi:toxin HigB-1
VTWGATVIKSFRSKALKRLWEKNDVTKLPPDRVERIRFILDRLDGAVEAKAMQLPGLGFHQLAGALKGRFAVTVSANWRITFSFDGEHAAELDFEDYH